MKRITMFLALFATFGASAAAQTIYVSPDVPTDPALSTDFLPWQWTEHDPGGFTGVTLTVPGDPQVDALHKMDRADSWLFSVEAPSDLGGSLAIIAEPRDVIRADAGLFTLFFCGAAVTGAVPLSSNVDALYLDGPDTGDLLVSFDVPTTIAGTTYDPADVVRYKPTASPPGCADWMLSGIEFDASAAGPGIPTGSNVIGADGVGGRTLLAFDIPSDLLPSAAPNPYLPGVIASWDGATFDLFQPLTAWPVSSQVDALSCQANPGGFFPGAQIKLKKVAPADIEIDCPGGCSSGAERYGLYEGTIASLQSGAYDHVEVSCTEVCPGTFTHTPPVLGSTYYLLVPHNAKDEGSYGTDSTGAQRPQAASPLDRCVEAQLISSCP